MPSKGDVLISVRKDPVLQGKQVLVVDDDPMILRSMNVMLMQAGLETKLVQSGPAALAYLEEFLPDIIILDYMMPEMTGAEVFDAMLTDSRFERARGIPVIMLTAKTNNYEEQRDLFKRGLSAYLFKPFGQKELFNVLGNIVVLESARRENERLLSENISIQNFLQGVFDSITDIVSIQDNAFKIIRGNSAAMRVAEGNRPALQEMCFSRYFGNHEICEDCPGLRTLKTGEPHSARIHSKGSIFEVRTYPVKSATGRAFIEMIKDVTVQQKMDEELAESAKLASIGTLAAGVAHEINNPLSIILGSAQALKSERQIPESVQGDLSLIEQEAHRCGKIVKDLLDYARPSGSAPVWCELNEICQNAVGLIKHFIRKKGIQFEESYDSLTQEIMADSSKIQQVLINVLMNAIQATSTGGRVKIATKRLGAEAEVSISDTGSGISEPDLSRIFEPFFSRKPGLGTGLGLSVSKSIISEHGGTIRIESQIGAGTRVVIRLPGRVEVVA